MTGHSSHLSQGTLPPPSGLGTCASLLPGPCVDLESIFCKSFRHNPCLGLCSLCLGFPQRMFLVQHIHFYWLTGPESLSHKAEENKLAPERHFQNVPELADFNLETAFG